VTYASEHGDRWQLEYGSRAGSGGRSAGTGQARRGRGGTGRCPGWQRAKDGVQGRQRREGRDEGGRTVRGRPRASSHHSLDVHRRVVVVIIDVERTWVMWTRGRPDGFEMGVNDGGARGGRVVQVLRRERPARQQGDTNDHDEGEADRPHATILQDASAETSSQAGATAA